MFSILVSETLATALLPSESKTEKRTGVTRRYHPAYRNYCPRWFCCGREGRNPGCMEAKHIDDRISREVERLQAIQESAREEARAIVFRSCEECKMDVQVEFVSEDEVEDSETEEDEDEEGDEEGDEEVPDEEDTAPPEDSVVPDDQHLSPDQNVPPTEPNRKVHERGVLDWLTLPKSVENISPLRPERFLCHSCKKKAAANIRPCTYCMRLYSHGTEPLGDGLCPDCKGENGYDEEFDFYNGWCPF